MLEKKIEPALFNFIYQTSIHSEFKWWFKANVVKIKHTCLEIRNLKLF